MKRIEFELRLALNALVAADAIAEGNEDWELSNRLHQLIEGVFEVLVKDEREQSEIEEEISWLQDAIYDAKKSYEKTMKKRSAK